MKHRARKTSVDQGSRVACVPHERHIASGRSNKARKGRNAARNWLVVSRNVRGDAGGKRHNAVQWQKPKHAVVALFFSARRLLLADSGCNTCLTNLHCLGAEIKSSRYETRKAHNQDDQTKPSLGI